MGLIESERSGGVIFPVHLDGRPDACRRANVREPKGGKLADEFINKSQFCARIVLHV